MYKLELINNTNSLLEMNHFTLDTCQLLHHTALERLFSVKSNRSIQILTQSALTSL